ncbi:hypothetical protein [Actinoplanes rectilineatus]
MKSVDIVINRLRDSCKGPLACMEAVRSCVVDLWLGRGARF